MKAGVAAMVGGMEWMFSLIVVALAAGWGLGRWQVGREVARLTKAVAEKTAEVERAQERERLEGQWRREQSEQQERQRQQFENTFKALSTDALRSNTEQFIALATQTFGRFQEGAKGDLEQRREAIEALVKPLRESLRQVDEKLQAVEAARQGAYTGLRDQVRQLLDCQSRLQGETRNLVHALKTPGARGRWGELQLERTVEFAGMTEHVEFIKQVHVAGEDGTVRPDLVVRLPGGKQIVVDAKAPLDAYLKALECDDREREAAFLEQHAAQIRAHIKALSAKRYWRQFESSPEFVVIFLPGEVFFSAALEKDPGLIEYGSVQNVLLATP
ncbi:MAG: DNA recombination protein RmuC, partial [Chthoniobacterales bacterium]